MSNINNADDAISSLAFYFDKLCVKLIEMHLHP